jgi:hypothetical protein
LVAEQGERGEREAGFRESRFHGFVAVWGFLLEDLLGTSGEILEFFFSFVHPHFL